MSKIIVFLIGFVIGYIRGHQRKKDEFYNNLWELENDRGYQMWRNMKEREDE